jgi:hypothetical protein
MTSGLQVLTLSLTSSIFGIVFERLRQFSLVINMEKCVFAVDSLEFLDHVVSAQGARAIISYVKAVEKKPPPTTIRELQVFLGLGNFYRRFLSGRHVAASDGHLQR